MSLKTSTTDVSVRKFLKNRSIRDTVLLETSKEGTYFWSRCYLDDYPFKYLENNLNKINKLLLLNDN